MKEIIRMNQLAGIITEVQAKKMLKALNENTNEIEIQESIEDVMPKYFIPKFQKATSEIQPEHEAFVNDEIETFKSNPEIQGTGANYASSIKQGYRAFRDKNTIYIAIHPHYYKVEI